MATRGEAVELEVGDQVVRVSNPSKVYFPEPGITKLELVQHYLDCGDGILRALRDRPTTLERWPGGVVPGMKLATRADNRGDAFYQKRVPQNAPTYVPTAHITFPSGRTADEIAPDSLAVVAWAANLGTITFHPWPVRRDDVDHPDELRIDLDPQPGTDFHDAVSVAAELQGLLAELGWTGWPKTSGGRGVHVYVRIEPRWTFTDVRHAAIAIGRELERRMPGRVTTKWWKEERGEAIFVDYNQNARDRTIASAYSVRPRPQATVSMPLAWDELPDVTPAGLHRRQRRQAVRRDRRPARPHRRRGVRPDPVLEWYARDERDHGLGDLPYPPEYPKMPGEPKRVQPSRDTLRPKD